MVSKILAASSAWKLSVFGVILVHIFLHLDWIRRVVLSIKLSKASNKKRKFALTLALFSWSKNLVVHWKTIRKNLGTPMRNWIIANKLLKIGYFLSLKINSQFHKLISSYAIWNFTSNLAAIWVKSAENGQCN